MPGSNIKSANAENPIATYSPYDGSSETIYLKKKCHVKCLIDQNMHVLPWLETIFPYQDRPFGRTKMLESSFWGHYQIA